MTKLLKSEILYRETQKFRQWWLWLLLLLPIAIFFYQWIAPIFQTDANNSGNLSISLSIPTTHWWGILLYLLVLLFFLFSKLKTNITAEEIQLKHLLFFKTSFKWAAIETAEIVTYGFVGYGIRLSIKYGTVYNVKGNQGLQITLKNGKKYLIGTQQPTKVNEVIEKLGF